MPDSNKRVIPMSNKTFDFLRAATQYWVPGFGAFYYAMSMIWGFPYGEQVVASAAALTTFLGIILGISRHSYESSGHAYDGSLIIDRSSPEKDIYSFELDRPLDTIDKMSNIKLNVKPKSH